MRTRTQREQPSNARLTLRLAVPLAFLLAALALPTHRLFTGAWAGSLTTAAVVVGLSLAFSLGEVLLYRYQAGTARGPRRRP